MKRVSILAAAAAAFVMAGSGVAYAQASAQQQAQQPERIDGKPNFNGVWQAMNTANWNLEDHSAAATSFWQLGAMFAIPAGQSVIVDNNGTIPYNPAGLKKRQENQAGWPKSDPEAKCYMPGVPRATYMPFPFQIFQSDKAFAIAYEYAGAYRNVYLKDPGPPQVDSWMGQSVGRWDGETFVIEANGFHDQSWFDRSGNHHSEALKVTERYTMISPDHIQYEATIEDPKTFTKPWKISMPLYRRIERNAQLMEFKCVEFVEELMYGRLRKRSE